MSLLEDAQKLIDQAKEKDIHVGSISDGYHTFDELYNHREVLTAALFNRMPFTWKARVHEDGTMFDGMFVVGMATPNGMITYHYDNEFWKDFKVPVLPHAPKFDGHTPNDVIDRIRNYCCAQLHLTDEEDQKMRENIQLIIDTFGPNRLAIEQYMSNFVKD